MTRINCGILPKELTNKHLFAEIREIKRIPNNIKSGKYNLKSVPSTFRLGTGHVSFFYDKLQYIHKRFNSLVKEWTYRGYNVSDYSSSFENLPISLYNDYVPTREDRKLLIDRLCSKDISYKNLKV